MSKLRLAALAGLALAIGILVAVVVEKPTRSSDVGASTAETTQRTRVGSPSGKRLRALGTPRRGHTTHDTRTHSHGPVTPSPVPLPPRQTHAVPALSDPAKNRPPLYNPGGVNGDRPPRAVPGLGQQR